MRAVPRLCKFYPGICLTNEEKARKNLSQGSQRVLVYILPKRTHTHTHTPQKQHIHTPTHYKSHTYTHPHITKATHTHTHTSQKPHIHTPTHHKSHTHTHTPTHYKPLSPSFFLPRSDIFKLRSTYLLKIIHALSADAHSSTDSSRLN